RSQRRTRGSPRRRRTPCPAPRGRRSSGTWREPAESSPQPPRPGRFAPRSARRGPAPGLRRGSRARTARYRRGRSASGRAGRRSCRRRSAWRRTPACSLLISAVNGFTMDETGEGGDPPADQPPPEQIAAMVRDYIAALPADRFPNMVAVADHFAVSDPDRRFDLLLDIYVDGLAERAREA